MSNETLANTPARFPETQKDLSNLKQTATDTASDLGEHSGKAKKQLGDLTQHVQAEGAEQLQQAKKTFAGLVQSTKTYVGQNPVLFIGLAAAAAGFLIGRRQSKD